MWSDYNCMLGWGRVTTCFLLLGHSSLCLLFGLIVNNAFLFTLERDLAWRMDSIVNWSNWGATPMGWLVRRLQHQAGEKWCGRKQGWTWESADDQRWILEVESQDLPADWMWECGGEGKGDIKHTLQFLGWATERMVLSLPEMETPSGWEFWREMRVHFRTC